MKKKYFIFNYIYPLWIPIHINITHHSTLWQILFPSAWYSSNYRDATRLNILQACYYYCYIRLTHKWMRHVKIKHVPLFWWEKIKSKRIITKRIKSKISERQIKLF